MPNRQVAQEAVQHDDVGACADSDVMQVDTVGFDLRHLRQPHRRAVRDI